MNDIAVVVDSGLDIPQHLLDKYGIYQVPVIVNWRGRQYRDRQDLTLDELFAQGEGSRDFPTTSQPSVGEFAAVYAELASKYKIILSLHIGATFSGTWSTAKTAADMVADRVQVRVYDTGSVSMGGGLQALAAAAAAKAGDIDAVVAAADRVREQMDIRLVLNTLEYVLRGGRISRLEAFLGSVLNIKPMLQIYRGEFKSAGRARSRSRSLEMLVDAVSARCKSGDGSNFVAAVGHAQAAADADTVISALKTRLPAAEIIRYQVGVGIGAHGGPGTLGVCFYNC